ncbi:MAG TPA: hypothetical protein VN203_18555 [Candidatus Acidoferrum sp.]|nr:hypothetical protein [Candidatus Acidoferrum sp.]
MNTPTLCSNARGRRRLSESSDVGKSSLTRATGIGSSGSPIQRLGNVELRVCCCWALVAVALLLLFPARLEAAYTYYYSDLLQSINLSNWQQNGSVTATTGGLTAPGANGGSLITLLANPYGLTQYEVNTVVVLAANGGTYVQYLAASSNAMTGPAATGSFFSVELQNPTVNGSGTVVLNKRENGSFTALTSASVYCHSGMKIRSVLVGANVLVYVEGSLIFNYQFGTLPPSFVGGKPGLGALATPAGNSISSVDLGPKDRYAPDPVNLQSIATSGGNVGSGNVGSHLIIYYSVDMWPSSFL